MVSPSYPLRIQAERLSRPGQRGPGRSGGVPGLSSRWPMAVRGLELTPRVLPFRLFFCECREQSQPTHFTTEAPNHGPQPCGATRRVGSWVTSITAPRLGQLGRWPDGRFASVTWVLAADPLVLNPPGVARSGRHAGAEFQGAGIAIKDFRPTGTQQVFHWLASFGWG